jgi:hypothetical protein
MKVKYVRKNWSLDGAGGLNRPHFFDTASASYLNSLICKHHMKIKLVCKQLEGGFSINQDHEKAAYNKCLFTFAVGYTRRFDMYSIIVENQRLIY